jgi:transketolase
MMNVAVRLPTARADAAALKVTAAQLRGRIIAMSHAAQAAHLASSLSCADILTAAYWHALNIDPQNPGDPLRDRFILSKGHAAAALYATLAMKGYFGIEEL